MDEMRRQQRRRKEAQQQHEARILLCVCLCACATEIFSQSSDRVDTLKASMSLFNWCKGASVSGSHRRPKPSHPWRRRQGQRQLRMLKVRKLRLPHKGTAAQIAT